MADFSEMLSQLLSSDEGKQQVSQVLNMLSKPQAAASAEAEQGSVAANNGSTGGGGGLDISSLLSAMGSGNGNSNGSTGGGGGLDISSLLSAMGNGNGNGGGGSGLPNLDIAKLMKIQQLLSQRREDNNTALLRALKPHLCEENRKKIDDAVRIMEILALLPLVKESGLLGSLLGGDS